MKNLLSVAITDIGQVHTQTVENNLANFSQHLIFPKEREKKKVEKRIAKNYTCAHQSSAISKVYNKNAPHTKNSEQTFFSNSNRHSHAE